MAICPRCGRPAFGECPCNVRDANNKLNPAYYHDHSWEQAKAMMAEYRKQKLAELSK